MEALPSLRIILAQCLEPGGSTCRHVQLLMALRARSFRSRCGQSEGPARPPELRLLYQHLRHLWLADQHPLSICTHHPAVCLSVPTGCLSTRAHSPWFRAPRPTRDGTLLLCFRCNDPFSKEGHIQRFWMLGRQSGNFRGTHSTL